MSSSKIIKCARQRDLKVSNVSYGGLSGADEQIPARGGAFLPLNFRNASSGTGASESAAAEAALPDSAEVDPGMVMVAEAELQQKLEAAFHKGIDEGRQQTERGLANVFRSLREAIDATMRLREKVLRESEEDLLKLAIMVARKIVQQEIRHDPQILANIVGETVSCCSDLDKITIRLNPDDCTLVSANRNFYLSGIGANTQVSLIPDEAILPGGCMVDTVTGTIDARIDVQLDEIYRKFMETRGVPDSDVSGQSEEIAL